MSRTVTLVAVLVLASTALAGCTFPGGDDGNGNTTTTTTTTTPPTQTTPTGTTPPTQDGNTTGPLTNSSFSVATSGIPGQALPGARFNFTVYVNGTGNVSTDHVGAHFADNATTTPLVASAMRTCEHGMGSLPGSFNVACRIDQTGTWYVYGHARANDTGGTFDWWATPVAVKVRNYTLNLTGAPTTPVLGNQSFTLTLAINGTDNVTSDHIGAHWFNATTASPTVAGSGGACAHVNAAVVGSHAIECRVPNTGPAPKAAFVYGHLRITEGGVTLEWWSTPVEVQVGPTLPLGG